LKPKEVRCSGKKQTLCCGFVGETAETEFGMYDILDTTISG